MASRTTRPISTRISTADAGPLLSGKADAAIIVVAADTDKIQKLLRVPNIRLMDFTPEAEAYTSRFPALSKVVLRQGAVEFDPLIPSDDITLLSTSVALVVRPDMQPALVSLLTHAVVHNPKPGFDKNGDPVLFYRAGEFPSANDPEFDVPNDARVVYKQGELPVVLKNLAPRAYSMHVPFSYTAFISDHAATLLGMVGILAIVLPMLRAIPAIYVWTIKRRLVYWYRQLKALERRIDAEGARYDRRGPARRIRPHRFACQGAARAGLLLRPALRPARSHRPGPPATCRGAGRHAHGGGVRSDP